MNEAEGQAAAIQAIATATADGLRKVAEATQAAGGIEAVQLRVAEKYIEQFGHIAKAGNTIVLPATLSDVASMIALATNVLKGSVAGEPAMLTTPAVRPPPMPRT